MKSHLKKTPKTVKESLGKVVATECAPLSTVNVIEMSEGRILGVVSFPETIGGYKAALKRFRTLCNENMGESTMTSREKIDFIDGGIEARNVQVGTWEVFLVHSKH